MVDVQGELFPTVYSLPGGGPIEAAAATTVKALRDTGTLDASHSLKVELIMQGAKALDSELRRGKITVAATTLFSKVVDISDGLPTVQQAVNDTFADIVTALQGDD